MSLMRMSLMYVSYAVTARGSPRQEPPTESRARAAADCNVAASHSACNMRVSLKGNRPSNSAHARAAADCTALDADAPGVHFR